jgi:hypothetical protein
MRTGRVTRLAVALAWVLMAPACETSPPSVPATPLPGAFSVRVSPDPVVFRQLYPGAGSLGLASPPPIDPRYYAATMTLMITERQGGTGHLDAVQTELLSTDGGGTPVGSFDGACDFANELTQGGNRTIPPHGTLEWCMSRLGTPDVDREYTLRVSARITDGLGNVTTATEHFAVRALR